MRHFLHHACLCLIAAAPVALFAQAPTFSAPKQINTGATATETPSVLFAGNFNGNGNTDLIVSLEAPDSVGYKFLTGNGIGDFSVIGSVNGPASIAQDFADGPGLLADVNGDGKDDIVFLLSPCVGAPCQHGVITVMLSKGNGNFIQGFVGSLPVAPGASLEGVVADFNKDGKPDIAVLAYYPLAETPAELCIFINQGNGTFSQTDYQAPAALGTEILPTNLVVGDFEGNGNEDIAVAFEPGSTAFPEDFSSSSSNPPEIITFAGNGKGDFGPGVTSYAFDTALNIDNGSTPSLFAAKLSSNNRTDLLTILGEKSRNTVRIPSLLANTSGRFYWSSAVYPGVVACTISSIYPFCPTILLDDFNGDGKPDLFYVGAQAGSLFFPAGIYLGLGNGAFKTPQIPLNVKNLLYVPSVMDFPLKRGAPPSLVVETDTIELFVNTTKP